MMPVPDAYKKTQAYDEIMRQPEDVIGDHIAKEQRHSRNDEMTGANRITHQIIFGKSSVYSDAEYEIMADEDTFAEAP